jgi:lipopolysaccharide export LptBFGC system permease protein LptF
VAGIEWAVRSTGYVDYMTSCGLSISKFVALMALSIPKVLLLVIPFALFISIILYYDMLAKNNELIVLEVSGLGKKQLSFPSFLLGLVGCFLSCTMTLYFVPRSNILFRNTLKIVESRITNLLMTSENFNEFQEITLYLRAKNEEDINFLVAYDGNYNSGMNKILYARSAKLLNDNHLELHSGNIQRFRPDIPNEINILFFDRLVLDLNDLYSVRGKSGQQNVDFMYLGELLGLEKKSLAIVGEILGRILVPIFSLLLAIFSSLLSLNRIPLGRTGNGSDNLKNIANYSLCALITALFFYLLRLAKSRISGFYFLAILIFLQVFYIFYSLSREMKLS